MKNFVIIISMYSFLAQAINNEQTQKHKHYNFDSTHSIIQTISKNKVIIESVLISNKDTKTFSDMNNNTWTQIPSNQKMIVNFETNDAAKELKKMLPSYISEAFISNERGEKVAFLSKPTYWSHKGKDKHEQPMQGKTWQGKLERDESTGIHQIQLSTPIYNSNKIIGSLVVGVSIAKWEVLQNEKP